MPPAPHDRLPDLSDSVSGSDTVADRSEPDSLLTRILQRENQACASQGWFAHSEGEQVIDFPQQSLALQPSTADFDAGHYDGYARGDGEGLPIFQAEQERLAIEAEREAFALW